jgi:hypothetical protein
MTNGAQWSDPDEWDRDQVEDDAGPLDGVGLLSGGPLDDTGPDDDLVDDSADCQPGGVLLQPDDVLDFLVPLIGPERAGPMALWCALVDGDDRTLPLVLPIAGAPVRPDADQLRAVVGQLGEVLHEVYDLGDAGGVVFAIVRRSGGDRGEVELAWAAALRLAADEAGLRLRAVAAVGRDRARVLLW